MLNIFDSIQSYAGKWTVVNTRKFSENEINSVISAKVVDSTYGVSMCFFMKDSTQKFIPISRVSAMMAGDHVDLNKLNLLTLSKQGEADIYRILEDQ